eukprot:scaffold116_cov334-Pavlova_lutheri.AAC.7
MKHLPVHRTVQQSKTELPVMPCMWGRSRIREGLTCKLNHVKCVLACRDAGMQTDKSMRGGGFQALQFAYVFTTSCKRSLELG